MRAKSSSKDAGAFTRREPLRDTSGDQTRVCVCILNWNGWRDTIECLESVLRLSGPSLQVLVLDNGSIDDSLTRLRDWAEGAIAPEFQTPRILEHLVCPPVRKPISHRVFERDGFESLTAEQAPVEPLILVANRANLGFAGGLNVGLRYALQVGRFDYVWLLNNDTVVRPDAVEHLVQRMQADPRIGLCGSTLLFYDAPELVQALGGFRYNIWFGLAAQIAQLERYASLSASDLLQVERAMFGVQGASVLVSTSFLQRVGLLSEDNFLYFEEQDWAVRARRNGYDVGYAPKSLVYHKEGRSTGNNSMNHRSRSREADYYQIQARLLFTRKFFPYALPTLYLGLFGVLLNRLRRRQFGRAAMIARLAVRMLISPVPRRLPESAAGGAGHCPSVVLPER